MLFQHALNDVFRRTDHVKVFMPFFNLRQHNLIDVERLIYDTDIFTGLFFIICLKVFKYSLAYIIRPIVDFKNLFTRFTGIIATGEEP